MYSPVYEKKCSNIKHLRTLVPYNTILLTKIIDEVQRYYRRKIY